MEIRSEYLANVCKEGDDHHKQLVVWVVNLKSKVWELECAKRELENENQQLKQENRLLIDNFEG